MIASNNETLITVQYSVFEEECRHCGNLLNSSEPIRVREFDSTIKDLIDFFGWSSLQDTYPDFYDELREGIWEHFYNAINFFCLSAGEDIVIDERSLELAYQAVKLEVDKLRNEEIT